MGDAPKMGTRYLASVDRKLKEKLNTEIHLRRERSDGYLAFRCGLHAPQSAQAGMPALPRPLRISMILSLLIRK